MKLQELLAAVQSELEEAGCSGDGSTLSLAFTVKRQSDGAVECDFVDAKAISKPRPEEIHRLELSMKAAPAKQVPPRDVRDAELGEEGFKEGDAMLPHARPPALPPKGS